MLYIKSSEKDKTGLEYRCARCGTFIAHSGNLTTINGADRHSFINPAGMRCNFMTLSTCENVLAGDELYFEHSWFPGYGWRFLVCGFCSLHLGWQYDSEQEGVHPAGFLGVLFNSVTAINPEN